MGDYIDYPKLRLAHSHLLLKLTLPIHYLSFGKLWLAFCGGPPKGRSPLWNPPLYSQSLLRVVSLLPTGVAMTETASHAIMIVDEC